MTGGSAGIGLAIVRRFSAEGARVIAADVQPFEDRTLLGDHVEEVSCDVADPDSVQSTVASAVRRHGTITNLVNCAGVIPPLETVLELELGAWNRTMSVNLTGVFLVAKAVIPHMIAAGGGNIVNIASEIGMAGSQGRSSYGTSKAGVIHLTKVLALDFAKHGIRVNALSPGAVTTERFLRRYGSVEAAEKALAHLYPIGRLGRPEEIAASALFLASDESSFMTGANLVVDGGYNAQ